MSFKEETKVFAWTTLLTALSAFLTSLAPALQELARQNWQGLVALCLVNGLLAAIETFTEHKTSVRSVKQRMGLSNE